jgi:hypothetical protein
MEKCWHGVVVGLEMGRGVASVLVECGCRGANPLKNAFLPNEANFPGSQQSVIILGYKWFGVQLSHFVTWLRFTKRSQLDFTC